MGHFFKSWFTRRVEKAPDKFFTPREGYANLKDWLNDWRLVPPGLCPKQFRELMRSEGYELTEVIRRGKPILAYRGLRLIPEYERMLRGWFFQRTEEGDGYLMSPNEAIESWYAWSKKRVPYPWHMTATRMGRLLHGMGIQSVRLRVGGRISRRFKNIRLVDEFENLEEK